MLKIFKKIRKESEKIKQISKLRKINRLFLDNLNYLEAQNLFEYLLPYIKVSYSKTLKQHFFLNRFFNNFFSKYDRLEIGEKNYIVIDYNMLDSNNYIGNDKLIAIGTDYSDLILVKKNSLKNGVFIETIDSEEDIKEEEKIIIDENFLYDDLHKYIVYKLCNYYLFSIEDKYNEMLQKT